MFLRTTSRAFITSFPKNKERAKYAPMDFVIARPALSYTTEWLRSENLDLTREPRKYEIDGGACVKDGDDLDFVEYDF